MSEPKDRRQKLREQDVWNGIDFVEVLSDDQTELRVHFVNDTPSLAGTLAAVSITGGDVIRTVAVESWQLVPHGAGEALDVKLAAAGDFSLYTLAIQSLPGAGKLDPFFDHATFSFKARCESTLDCEEPERICPPEPVEIPPIDYLAKDFASFKQALLDFSALRYPEWRERSEADFGIMMLEALASVADDLSYTQDRLAWESYLETAVERRSVQRHARLVDYEIAPVLSARAWLCFDVVGQNREILAGLPLGAHAGDRQLIPFETGEGLSDATAYAADERWNVLVPYFWDDSQACLPAGSTEMWLVGHGLGLALGQRLVIDTRPPAPGMSNVRELVELSADPLEELDPLYGKEVTRIRWDARAALAHDHYLGPEDDPRTTLNGNVVPATQGERFQESFAIGGPIGTVPAVVTRTGPDGTPQFFYTLGRRLLAWLSRVERSAEGGRRDHEDPLDPEATALPEIQVTEERSSGQPLPWSFVRWLLDAGEFDEAFTLDPVRYSVVGRRPEDGSVYYDYDGEEGDSLRFGDGTFGAVPNDGALFRVLYRCSVGARGNVPADAVTALDPRIYAGLATRVTNPFPAWGGQDRESLDSVRKRAPYRFRSRLLRAVRLEDYRKAIQELSWVQRAGAAFRYTGSWISVFTTADPENGAALSADFQTELIALTNRRRLAGYEVNVVKPRYVGLDLEIALCARPDAFRGDVMEAVLDALRARDVPGVARGFFHVDHFTFGTPLELSALAAAVQRAHGVDGVRGVRYRKRGQTGFVELIDQVSVGMDEILRVDNDPNHPEAGSILLEVEGGK